MQKNSDINHINNDFDSYNQLINFYVQNKDKFIDNITLNINGWFSANACSMLGAILTKFQNDLNTVIINTGNSKDILKRNGFLSFFGHKKSNDYYNTTLPYQVLSTKDDRYFNNYVLREFLSRSEFSHMTNILKKSYQNLFMKFL